MIRANLTGSLRSAIERALDEKRTIKLDEVRFSPAPNAPAANVTVMPIVDRRAGGRLLAVAFEEVRPATVGAPSKERQPPEDNPSVVSQLEFELEMTKEDHRTAVERLETANENLRITNEEAMSINEEMQSANEELEASKEELQSINEELATVDLDCSGKRS